MFDVEKILAEYGLTPERYENLLKDCSDKVHKISDMDWSEIAEKYGIEFNPDTLRKGSQPPLIGGTFVKEYYQQKYEKENHKDDDNYSNELMVMKRELEKAKVKLQTEKLEYSKWLREDARDELITEKIINAVNELEPLKVPEYIEPVANNKSYLLVFGDAHYGIEFNIKDLFGNTINEYNPDIFAERMWELMREVVTIVRKDNIDELNIWELGDGIQGILRLNSQLMKLKYGIIESSIRYANFLATWLNELSEYVRIKFQMVIDSNHNQLRICGAPKNAFGEENMSKVMLALIKERIKDNPNIKIIENPTGMNYGLMSTYSVLGMHGEVKDLEKSLNDFARAYQTHLDYIIGAHCHHSNSKEVGMDAEAISIRSIIGVDPYGMSLNKTSNAGASLFEFEQCKGLICEYKIKLN